MSLYIGVKFFRSEMTQNIPPFIAYLARGGGCPFSFSAPHFLFCSAATTSFLFIFIFLFFPFQVSVHWSIWSVRPCWWCLPLPGCIHLLCGWYHRALGGLHPSVWKLCERSYTVRHQCVYFQQRYRRLENNIAHKPWVFYCLLYHAWFLTSIHHQTSLVHWNEKWHIIFI